MSISRAFASSFLRFGLLFAAAALQPAQAQTPTVVWQQSVNFSTFSDWGPSQRTSSGSVNAEIADDFNVVGSITRIDVNGFGVSTQDAAFAGIYVHFYAYGADNLPGALQAEYFIPKGDARILNPVSSPDFRVDLGSAFRASGRHFVSVQVLSANAWYWRSADDNAPRGTALYYRNPTAGQANWSHSAGVLGTANSDAAFTLYGTSTLGAPTVSALSAATLAQAGRLKISGGGFGALKETGVVTIGGAIAPVSNWSDNSITAYVPETAPLATDNVQVVTSGGTSNALPLQVTARPPTAGHVKWRFQADGFYIQGRVGMGPDGTIYALDVGGHLYALTPAGGVKWIFNTSSTAVQSVDVGADGTIYFGSAVNSIYAVHPDGTLKWKVTDPSGADVVAGPNVGPDGNIYGVTQDGGLANGLGEMSISPAGAVLSHRSGYVTGTGRRFRTREIVFGATNRFYFVMNNVDNNLGLQFFQLGGAFLFARSAGGSDEQPAVDASGNIISNIAGNQVGVFDTSGNLLRSIFFSGTLSAPNLGSDGTIYEGESYPSNLRALNPNLSVKWAVANTIGYYAAGPVVDPFNSLVIVGANAIGGPSAVQAFDAKTGILSWQSDLPAENGGYVSPFSRPRFSTDGASAYIGMDVNDGAADPYTYLYAFDTGVAPAPASISALSLNPTSVTGGNAAIGTVTLDVTVQTATVVALTSNTAAATVPPSVTVPAGSSSGTFGVNTSQVSATTNAILTATLNGASRSATLTVNPMAPASDTLAITRADYGNAKHVLSVQATSTRATATLKVYVTSTAQLIGTLTNNRGGKYSGQFNWAVNPGNITVRSDLGGEATRGVTLK